MIHRYLATSLGFMSLVILFFSIKYREEKNVTVTLPIMLVCAVILQGMFGMWTVTLKLWPQVVTVHLLGGFTVLSIIWLIVLSISKNAISQETKIFNLLQREKKWVYLATAVVIIQIAIGGWTTSNYAAVACPDFPTCQGEWWPPMDFESGFNFIQKIGPNYLGGQLHNSARVAIHMLHRIWAIVTVISLILMGLRLLQLNISPIRSKVFAVWGVLFVQVILGVSNIVFNFPIGVAVAHNAIAALLIMKLLSLLFFMSVSSHEYNKSV